MGILANFLQGLLPEPSTSTLNAASFATESANVRLRGRSSAPKSNRGEQQWPLELEGLIGKLEWPRLALGAFAATPVHAQNEPLKVFVSAGFEGNTWMDASLNLLRAIAKTAAYKDRVELDIQSARGDAQTQLQQINAMVQAGADIIVAWPISPTALNRAVRTPAPRASSSSPGMRR